MAGTVVAVASTIAHRAGRNVVPPRVPALPRPRRARPLLSSRWSGTMTDDSGDGCLGMLLPFLTRLPTGGHQSHHCGGYWHVPGAAEQVPLTQ